MRRRFRLKKDVDLKKLGPALRATGAVELTLAILVGVLWFAKYDVTGDSEVALALISIPMCLFLVGIVTMYFGVFLQQYAAENTSKTRLNK